MIAEMKSYRAVICACCNEPIPISQKVATLLAEAEHEEKNAARAFISRCKLCECERVYTISDLRRIEGEPPLRRPRVRAATPAA